MWWKKQKGKCSPLNFILKEVQNWCTLLSIWTQLIWAPIWVEIRKETESTIPTEREKSSQVETTTHLQLIRTQRLQNQVWKEQTPRKFFHLKTKPCWEKRGRWSLEKTATVQTKAMWMGFLKRNDFHFPHIQT